MSVQFGRWNFAGQQSSPDYIKKVSESLAPYGPDSDESYSQGEVKILYRAFHTTKESHREVQPHVSASGAVITWDGRLDNRTELISELRDSLSTSSTDVDIVAAAYEKWSANCFAKLIGDWALSIWNPIHRSLILAKDPIGTRHLYYSFDNNRVTWSTVLDPLVLFAGKTFAISEEYMAGWLSTFPAAHLTPYVGIHAVPPSSLVLLRPGKQTVSKYWDFDPEKTIRYRTDAEYEEHFRTVFAKAVQRRLRSDRPILAELSGGIDSSSIVCMADTIIACGAAETPRLDTISWYDDSNPGLDERPYFTRVEEKRGRTGCHIDLGAQRNVASERFLNFDFQNGRFAPLPILNSHHSDFYKKYAAYVVSQGYRVTLSGLGGESATGGGVPTPTPELQNLLARAQFATLARQLKAWAAKMRKRRLPLLWEAARAFVYPLFPIHIFIDTHLAPWLHPVFVRRNRAALRSFPSRLKLFGPLPSFQNHLDALDGERKLMAYCSLSPDLLREVRYPYLDLGLLEFVYAVPREQIVRVGQRRSLMRRSLVRIVPDELLNRKQKAFVQQVPGEETSTQWPSPSEIGQHMISTSIGIIDSNRFWEALHRARHNQEVHIESLKRTLFLESWLRHLTMRGILTNSLSTNRRDHAASFDVRKFHVPARHKSSAS